MLGIKQCNIDVYGTIKTLGYLIMVLVIIMVQDSIAKSDISPSGNDAEQLLRHPEVIQDLIRQHKITGDQIPYPHWSANGCIACHEEEASSTNKKLKTGDINKLCNNCHKTEDSHSIIHPVEVRPSDKMFSRMPKDFSDAIKRSNGKMNCLTCHSVEQTCSDDREKVRSLNPLFFRGGSYEDDRTRLCFYCHDEGQYERLNPHKQIKKDGSINEQSCYVCHENMPDAESITNIGQLYFNVEDNYSSVEDDYSLMCNGCHPWKPHPGGTFSFQKSKVINHLVVPPDKMMRQLQHSDIYLPLEPGTKRVFCGTCHNVHEKGVIKRKAAAQGAGSKHFLRDQDLCVHCHAK
ncbi:MAG: hypothetical protein OEZ38_03085 [Gammaproteobacteria bacterium]|nr:hypothetical protein [Gammaproteobacteria bacterium]